MIFVCIRTSCTHNPNSVLWCVSCEMVYAVKAKSIGKQGTPDAGLVEASVLAVLDTCFQC